MLDGGPLLCWPRIDKSEVIDMDENGFFCTCYWVLGNLKAVPPRAHLST